MMTPTDKEHMRRALLAALYNLSDRPRDLHEVIAYVLQQAYLGFQFGTTDALREIAFLKGMKFVEETHSALGASSTYALTPDGILFQERNGTAK